MDNVDGQRVSAQECEPSGYGPGADIGQGKAAGEVRVEQSSRGHAHQNHPKPGK